MWRELLPTDSVDWQAVTPTDTADWREKFPTFLGITQGNLLWAIRNGKKYETNTEDFSRIMSVPFIAYHDTGEFFGIWGTLTDAFLRITIKDNSDSVIGQRVFSTIPSSGETIVLDEMTSGELGTIVFEIASATDQVYGKVENLIPALLVMKDFWREVTPS